MPEDDPTEELNEIIRRFHDGKLPQNAYDFANDTLERTEEILETIEEMEANGHDRSPNQEEALENIYIGACKWLKRKP